MRNNMPMPVRKALIHKSTPNKSFLNMHYYLKHIGITNNDFMLTLLDPDLASIDPHDPKLNTYMKRKVLRECMFNYWYFLREVIRIPVEGTNGISYELHRGNLAINYCMILNLNIYGELPRQWYKTVTALCRYLYLFNFGTSNSQISFLNKKMEDSKRNLKDLKDLRDYLPPYLKMDSPFMKDNKRKKMPDTVETLEHPVNGNKIKAVPGARSRSAAISLLRGQAVPLFWGDEWAFILYNDTIWVNAAPAFSRAQKNAKTYQVPYGSLLTSTPGILSTEEGENAYNTVNDATPFSEMWYDMSIQQIYSIIDSNTKSNFVYIRFTYPQLGGGDEYFTNICKDMKWDWAAIRREVLLEWSITPDNSPFTTEELEAVSRLVKEPIRTVYILGKYKFDIYETLESLNNKPKYVPIIGVDASGGFKRDRSAICCVDSRTTKVFADLVNNSIAPHVLANIIYEIVTKMLPNAVVNIERNGGYGGSVVSKLMATNIKKNLYYEIKDRILEETHDGIRIVRKKQKTKVYGYDSSKNARDILIEILRERMELHKDKFISKNLYNELIGLEIKRNGKVEHSANTHDDLIFAYLMSLYVWYEGINLRENFGIEKTTIKTDESIDEVMFGLEEKYGNIIEEITMLNTEVGQEINSQLADMDKAKGKMFHEWLREEEQKDNDALEKILLTSYGRKAYARQYNAPLDEIQQNGTFNVPSSVFSDFYKDEENEENNRNSNESY